MSRRIRSGGLRHATVVVVTTTLILGAALSGATVGVVDADDPSISVTNETSGNAVEAPTGETVTMTVGANASNVAAYQANLTFDPDVVRVVSVEGTDDFGDPVTNVDNENGWVAFNQYRSSNVSDPQLATMTVELVGDTGNETAFSFVDSDTRLSDDAAQEQGLQQYDGLTVVIESDSSGSDGDGSESGDGDGRDGGDGDGDGGDEGGGSDGSDNDDDDGSNGDSDGDDDDGDDGSGGDDGDDGDQDDGHGDDDSGSDNDGGDNDSSDSNDGSQSDDDSNGSSSDDDDDDAGGNGGGSPSGESSDAEENDEASEGPPRVASDTMSLDGDASVVTTFDESSPRIERLELLFGAVVSGEYVTTEFERLPTDLADSRGDANDIVTVLQFGAPDGYEGAPEEVILTLNRSAVNASEENVDGLQIEHYNETTGQWEVLDAAIDGSNEETVTLTATPSRLGWFVVSAGNSSRTDPAAASTNETSPGSTEDPNGTSSDSAGSASATEDDADATANESDTTADESDTTNASSTEDPDATQTEVPGFGVTSVLVAGVLLYGFFRFGRRKR